MPDLKIPFAFDKDKRIIHPEAAVKEVNYFCPGCGETLIFRKGEKKQSHFAHSATDHCSYETVIHALAKQQIIEDIQAFISKQKPSPVINRECQTCSTTSTQELPDRITDVVPELKLENGYIVDVGILSGDKVAAAIEVKVTHAVPEEKKIKLGIPFIEVSGEKILETPGFWYPVTDNFKPFRCKTCNESITKFRTKLHKISKESGVALPTKFYRSMISDCWKCQKEILVFSWPGHEMGQRKPQNPIPSSIQYRYSKTLKEKYWANTCPYCKSIQGDFFLYDEPDGSFYCFECGDNDPNSFIEDMNELSLSYYFE